MNTGICCEEKKEENKFKLFFQGEVAELLGMTAETFGYIYPAKTGCITLNCSLKNPLFWKFAIKNETKKYAEALLKVGTNEVEGFLDCKLRKMRLLKTRKRILYSVLQFSMKNLSRWKQTQLNENSVYIDKLLENLKAQWKEFTEGIDGEELEKGSKCQCTILWEKNQKRYTKIFEEIAHYAPTDINSGCPLHFDHRVKF